MATVSIIIPAYNAAETLPATLQSVLAQTYGDFELWVVNDGSRDGTTAVVQAQSDPRIHLIEQGNTGAAAARNAGVAASQGELVTFLDADDRWTPEKLADQVAALGQNPQAVAVYSWTDYIDRAGQPLYPGGRVHHQGDVYGALFCQNFIENGSNLMVRRAALAQVGGFDPSLDSAHDWELWLRLAEYGEFVRVPKAQILYRVMEGSISSHLDRQEQNVRRVLNRALVRSPQRLLPHRRTSLTNLYQYLTFRSLSLGQTRWQYLQSLRYLLLAWCHGPQLLQQRSRLMAITSAKILLGLLLSPPVLRRRFSLH